MFLHKNAEFLTSLHHLIVMSYLGDGNIAKGKPRVISGEILKKYHLIQGISKYLNNIKLINGSLMEKHQELSGGGAKIIMNETQT